MKYADLKIIFRMHPELKYAIQNQNKTKPLSIYLRYDCMKTIQLEAGCVAMKGPAQSTIDCFFKSPFYLMTFI